MTPSFILSGSTMEKIREVNEFWGDQMPINLMEEVGEMLVPVSKMERELLMAKEPAIEGYKEDFVKEAGDVMICILALCERYSIDPWSIISRIDHKLTKKYE